MFRLHELLKRYADEAKTQRDWELQGREDMVRYTYQRLVDIRAEIEQDILDSLRRASR